jgi:hypothetical protein
MTEPLTSRVTAVDDDWRQRMEHKLDQLIEAWMGSLRSPGGALARIDDLERRLKVLEGSRGWLLGVVTAVLTSTLTAVAIAAVLKGGKP